MIPKCPIIPINGCVVLASKGLRFVTVSSDEVNIVEEVKGEESVTKKYDLEKCGKEWPREVGLVPDQFFVGLGSFVLQVCGAG